MSFPGSEHYDGFSRGLGAMNIDEALLPKPSCHPAVTFLVKGEKGSGKSTLVNALLGRDYIRSQSANGQQNPLFLRLSDTTERVDNETKYDVKLNTKEISGLLPLIGSLQYTFIDSTDVLSSKW